MDNARSTTHPSESTAHDGSGSSPSCVRWVFPAEAVTPLVGRSVVGRESSCDTVLGGHEISRRHAELSVDGPLVSVRDLESRNGVFVNGVGRTDAPLVPGDVLRLGEWIGVVTAASDDAGFKEIAPGWFGGRALAAVAEPARRVAADLPIIVQGETGTGKEGMARGIHGWSGRSGALVAVNCAAVPVHLAESELFGHRKGAFTGADRPSLGLFRAAHRGTLFLDEILELPTVVQPKLLRALEEREVLPLGETSPVPVDVRIVVATQEPLAQAVAEGRFRADLHARLDGMTVVLPPLRDRREDIVPLLLEFLRQHTGGQPPALDPKLVEALCLYDWPLNVRELVLLVRSLLGVHGLESLLKKAHLPERILARSPEDPSARPPARPKRGWRRTDDEAEFDALVQALRAHGGSVARAAAAIGMHRARAYRLLSAHPDFSPSNGSGPK
jgi:transcriptional regulator with AAA-type ATPase domain